MTVEFEKQRLSQPPFDVRLSPSDADEEYKTTEDI